MNTTGLARVDYEAMLNIKRPTATTVLYTVSTRAPAKTFTARLSAVFLILVRLLAAFGVLLILLEEYQTAFPSLVLYPVGKTAAKLSEIPDHATAQFHVATATSVLGNDGGNNNSTLAYLDNEILNGSDGITISATSSGDSDDIGSENEDTLSFLILQSLWQHSLLLRLGICAVTTYLVAWKGYREETLLVMRGLGVQTSTSSATYLWPRSTARFIPTSAIQDLFIHEAFRGFEVRFYLGIVVEGEEGVVGVFPSILPRREILEVVWRGAKACLYEPQT